MDVCQVDGCERAVSKAGYAFCLDHWKAERNGKVKRCATCGRWHENAGPLCRACEQPPAGEDDSAGGLLSSTRIGKHFGLSNIKVNLILAELGWIEKYVKGWVPTDRGNALGANVREARNGTPFVVWPDSILKNAALRESVTGRSAGVDRPAAPRGRALADKPGDKSADSRAKFPATFLTQDGHMVRSRAEGRSALHDSSIESSIASASSSSASGTPRRGVKSMPATAERAGERSDHESRLVRTLSAGDW